MSFYTFMRDARNHEKAVARRLDQLDLLDKLIDERTDRADKLQEQVDELEARVAEIKAMYPGKSEEDALKKYFEDLKKENSDLERNIASNKEKLDIILKKMKIALQLKDIALERENLERERTSLLEFKNSFIKVDDIIFAWYYLSDETSIAVSAFTYLQDTTYEDDDEKVICKGVLYKSISGNRILGFTRTLGNTLYTNDCEDEDYDATEDTEIDINTTAEVWITFADACLAIGSDKYMSGVVSVSEIDEVLKAYLNKNKVIENEDEDLVIVPKK